MQGLITYRERKKGVARHGTACKQVWSMYRHRLPDNATTDMAKAKNGDVAATARCLTAISDLAEVNVLKIALRDLLISQVTCGNPMAKIELDGAPRRSDTIHHIIIENHLS